MAAKPFLATPAATREILQKYDLRMQKKYGQNFLIGAHIPEKIVEAAQVNEADCILEIGPGIGTLTQFLAEKAGSVIAVEIDGKLIPVLQETLSAFPNAEVLHADILEIDLAGLLAEKAAGRPVKVVANLPYYITTPILMTMLEASLPVESYTLMVQKEVADRMQAGPGSKDYGALSLAVQYYTVPQVVMQVSPNCFLPRPNVGSTVIRLTSKSARLLSSPAAELSKRRDACAWSGLAAALNSQSSSSAGRPPTPALCDNSAAGEESIRVTDEHETEELLFRIIRAAFNQRRKTLANALKNSAELTFTREEIEQAIAESGFRPDIRGEALSLDDYQRLTRAIKKATV